MKLEENIKIIVFFILIFISYRFNYNLDNPKDSGLNHLLLMHHILAIYISVGWLLLPKRYLYVYLFITLGSFIHWTLNNNRCVLTDIYYHMIGKADYFNETNRIYMRDIYWLFGVRSPYTRDIFYRVLVISGCIYCIYNKIY